MDMSQLPDEVREKLAELELELSEGEQKVKFVFIFICRVIY
jgi:hypothetical protein